MKKILFSSCLILFLIICFSAHAQAIKKRSFVITSFEGKQVRVNIHFDYVNNGLTIKLGHSDSICIKDFMDYSRYEKLRVFDNRFIVLPFEVRGGSGEGPSETLILCVTKGRLHIAFIASSERWLGGGENDQDGICQFKVIDISNDTLNSYKLIAKQYQRITSTHHPKRDYEALDTLYFNFDKESKVFYNQRVKLNGNYEIDSAASHRNKNFKSYIYPAIEIKRHSYLYDKHLIINTTTIFIDGKWYFMDNYHKNQLKQDLMWLYINS